MSTFALLLFPFAVFAFGYIGLATTLRVIEAFFTHPPTARR